MPTRTLGCPIFISKLQFYNASGIHVLCIQLQKQSHEKINTNENPVVTWLLCYTIRVYHPSNNSFNISFSSWGLNFGVVILLSSM
jgi:hypothetical protein